MSRLVLSLLLAVGWWPAAATEPPTATQALRHWAQTQGLSVLPVDSVGIYTTGYDKFAALMADIDGARRSVDVEYFIYANDSIGQAMTQLLLRKAAEGVRVRLVVDDYKATMRHYGFDDAYCSELRRQGIDIRMFDPWRFPYVNHIARDHRKIVVVDDSIGYIGGLNVADYYLCGDTSRYGRWRDTHVRLTGSAVGGLSAYFDAAYQKAGGEAVVCHLPCATSVAVADSAFFFERSRASHDKKAETRRAYVAAFKAARHKLLIVNPYFMPTHSVRRALVEAIDRGVEVEILLSAVSDEPTLNQGCLNFARRLVRHGARVYLYRGAFHHSKILMIDDEVAMVGSANLNSRSLRWDYEASCFLFSPSATQRLTEVFERDKQRSDTLTLEAYRQRPRGQRAKGYVVNHLLTPFL